MILYSHVWMSNSMSMTTNCRNCGIGSCELSSLAPCIPIIKSGAVLSMSCCSGQTGASRWDVDSQSFKCIDCGSITSTDPSYLGSRHSRIIDTPGFCDHVWKKYQGLKEEFDYCTRCDKKR